MWTAENHFHSGMTGFRGGVARSVILGLQSVSILAQSLLCGIVSAPGLGVAVELLTIGGPLASWVLGGRARLVDGSLSRVLVSL